MGKSTSGLFGGSYIWLERYTIHSESVHLLVTDNVSAILSSLEASLAAYVVRSKSKPKPEGNSQEITIWRGEVYLPANLTEYLKEKMVELNSIDGLSDSEKSFVKVNPSQDDGLEESFDMVDFPSNTD